MMSLGEITLVAPPSASGEESAREFYRYDKFADELRAHTSAPVRVIEDAFESPPTSGIVLLDHFGATARDIGWSDLDEQVGVLSRLWTLEQRRRIFCLNTARGAETLSLLGRLELAGAIDSIDYQVAMRGMVGSSSYGDSGLYGRGSVVREIGCAIDYDGDSYSKTVVPPFSSLGELLGRYLSAYWSSVG
jgi:hypothetical protein